MKKNIKTFFTLLVITQNVHAQILDSNTIKKSLDSLMTVLKKNISTYQRNGSKKIVSDYTFRTLFKNDLSTLVGDKTKIGKYASIDLSSAQQKFTLCPFVYAPDPMGSPSHFIQSIEISGSLVGENGFNFKDRNTITGSYNLTWAFGKYHYQTEEKYSRYKQKLIRMYAKVKESLYTTFSSGINITDSLDLQDDFKSVSTIKKAYYGKVIEYEKKMSDSLWKNKNLFWIKLNITPLSFDNFYYYDTANINSVQDPIHKSVYNPMVQVSANFYQISPTHTRYLSGWIKISRKHSFSDMSTPNQWNKINRLNDSVYLSVENKSVYQINEKKFYTQPVIDFGLQGVFFPRFKYHHIDMGIDLKYSNIAFITPDIPNKLSHINNITLGLIFPLKDSDGKSTINLEPFFQYRRFTNFELASDKTWGIQFSLPFTNLF